MFFDGVSLTQQDMPTHTHTQTCAIIVSHTYTHLHTCTRSQNLAKNTPVNKTRNLFVFSTDTLADILQYVSVTVYVLCVYVCAQYLPMYVHICNAHTRTQ